MWSFIWNDLLYQPLFNVLIWFYNNYAHQNLGWAVVYLTIFLRIILLPLTFVGERNKIRDVQVQEEIKKLEKEFRNDPAQLKTEIRQVARANKIHPWAKAISLGIQLLVLVLLYQVFLQGITGEKLLKTLYDWVDFPGSINVYFYGFNLGHVNDIFWPGLVAIILLVEIYIDFKKHKKAGVEKSDLFYFVLFPAFSFYILWLLPMVKSLFIITSMFFGMIERFVIRAIVTPKKEEKK
ncbi:MAG: YidC/Oxa1 family membrane protein insertase [Patescibacteria group bacterium]|nr:YidC/Oxa1 family membrane protein insertase [Patescibacteria group bacterium]